MKDLKVLVELRDLRTQLEALDDEIAELRQSLPPSGSAVIPATDIQSSPATLRPTHGQYDAITDKMKLGKLVKAREKTKETLETKLAWNDSQKEKPVE